MTITPEHGAPAIAADAVATWTMVSRVSGVAKVAAIGAILGPTYFGNTYQFTNSLPNLVYYGFLAGSLFSSLLVPALVGHIDSHNRQATERVAGGFLGLTLLALIAIGPLAVLLGPEVLKAATLGGDVAIDPAQVQVGRWLIIMFIPQIFCYAVVGTASAAMNASRRFALAAAAPALENIGILFVLGITAVAFGTDTQLSDVPTGELLLLGLGTTGAVAAHAGAQWWGARRAGVVLMPKAGWRDPEVRIVIRRSLPAVAQAGLVALQVLTLLVIANRVAGGVVAFQIALNFYFLAIALGATPVALSILPRLSRMHRDGDTDSFRETIARGYALGLFVTIPAAVGYLVLALPIARAISFGRMNTSAGVSLIAVSLAALSVAVVGQTIFMIASYSCYARMDTRTPLLSMTVQALACLTLASIGFRVHGSAVPLTLGLAFSASIALAAAHITWQMRRQQAGGRRPLRSSLTKVSVGAVTMAGPALVTAMVIPMVVAGSAGRILAAPLAVLVGSALFIASQSMLRTPELLVISGSLGQLRGKTKSLIARPSSG
jgi:putative peptidoglycan lipid II flippase